ncbi:endonuclease YncB(thermonuclease family) [Litorivivens lipolytica]|uniref:Endonuclease YncB(Thermonuclease family) n=1 Tax=Litorivivens lipolytica TaxID=1524264 RepID=A0A7W4Z734_9GAMM|nr:thermonuclease family protein [Litorivivens lipolytica]MBB3047630.1 endonuclease YncB(thermonuclease family) [Litorivivens lipolytica]
MNKKAPGQLWLGVFVCAFLFLGQLSLAMAAPGRALCSPPANLEAARLDSVVDGDTLRLTDGRMVRLIGVNTPEIGRDGKPHEPFAVEAAKAVERFLGRDLLLAVGQEATDRHGRTLAAVYRARDRGHLGEYLLLQGLGWHIVVPPNVSDLSCLQQAEGEARKRRRGVWNEVAPLLKASELDKRHRGFQRVTGTVSRVDSSRSAIWVEIDRNLSLRLSKRDLPWFSGIDIESLAGEKLTVRGWLIYRSGHNPRYPAHMMSLRHPAMLELDKD